MPEVIRHEDTRSIIHCSSGSSTHFFYIMEKGFQKFKVLIAAACMKQLSAGSFSALRANYTE